MDKKVTITFNGIIPALLGVAFVILKLCKVINWPWIWVVAPFWIPIALSVIIILIVALIAKITNY